MGVRKACVAVAIVSVVIGLIVGRYVPSAAAQVGQTIAPEKMRFRMFTVEEPVAGPGGTTIVNGAKVVIVKDMKGGQCYIAFVFGASIGITGPSACLE